ncbi:hypothetical protein N7478_000447 [Penicillium angulare]|uniref:uncharacterized protein n=1 Tax=Penicillium angulare TaxID=116970 RepID=UPI0025415177|nr:uncharacterized protein N7478_000447 [Penicillium angulare]KAJ5291196.1 hypothetical protein N7478_000447 [Penicillium angulare]
MINTEDKYAFGRDKKESERTKDDVFSIADIATGTGIWLEDVSNVLDKAQVRSYCHGFDISAEQFPEEQSEKVQFSVQDITAPFPKEHCNRYDIVHVRLVVAAISESDYRTAIDNISVILKPGGFLQWEEIDEETYISKDNPVIWEIGRCFDFSLKAEGKCFQASAKVASECTAAGFLDVLRLFYRSDATDDPHLRADTEQRLAAIMNTLYASLLLRSGQVPDEETASKRAGELIEQHHRLCAEGLSPPLTVMRVVAQKPLDAPL